MFSFDKMLPIIVGTFIVQKMGPLFLKYSVAGALIAAKFFQSQTPFGPGQSQNPADIPAISAQQLVFQKQGIAEVPGEAINLVPSNPLEIVQQKRNEQLLADTPLDVGWGEREQYLRNISPRAQEDMRTQIYRILVSEEGILNLLVNAQTADEALIQRNTERERSFLLNATILENRLEVGPSNLSIRENDRRTLNFIRTQIQSLREQNIRIEATIENRIALINEAKNRIRNFQLDILYLM